MLLPEHDFVKPRTLAEGLGVFAPHCAWRALSAGHDLATTAR